MKEIVLLSGKGGTGKSTLTATLGSLLAEQYTIVMADTDVDAPNLHLVLGGKEKEVQDIKASDKATIDYDLCSRCLECIEVCRFDSIIATDEPIIISHSCEGCGACVIVCPAEAIQIRTVVNGRLRILETTTGLVVSGELGVGESSSGKLVDVVKKRALAEAEQVGADFILTDGPPGIGCPVIASVKGADFVLMVTEPTPSGLHDLKRVIEAISFFKIPFAVVLNRSDLIGGIRKEVIEFLDKNNISLLAEIPFDLCLPRALADGKLSIISHPEAPSSRALVKLGIDLEQMLSQAN
jgi:MinD superfamily P-loop ATPase